jgi:hypothetical protein
MEVAGISYAVDEADREIAWDADGVRRDLQAIRDQLHCTAVLLFGASVERLEAAGEIALALGLDVWVQPRLQNRRRRETVAHLAEGAAAAERLRVAHPPNGTRTEERLHSARPAGGTASATTARVTLVLGCEHSLFARGLIPGPHLLVRLRMLRFAARRRLRARVARRLDRLLADAVAAARPLFGGPITYGAGYWELVDWTRFDVAGVNLYRFAATADGYEDRVRALVRDAARPVAITEFGCCAHRGADRSGPAGFQAVDWLRSRPRLREGVVRDEGVQATYLTELIDLYATAGVHAAFAFTFAMPAFPHRPDDPRHDLDTAGFGVVKVSPGDPHDWEPKEAFAAVAGRYGTLTRDTS